MAVDVLKPILNQVADPVWPVERGYDLVANEYDQWYWQAFWRANELPLVVRELGSDVKALTALDAGTGTGQYLEVLNRKGYQSSGLDISREMLQVARKKLGHSAHLVCGALEFAPFRTASFDVIIACRVLSHVARIGRVLKEMARVIRPGGRLVLTDVSSEHNYVRTRIPTRAGYVHIETYKHDTREILSKVCRQGGWCIDRMDEVRFGDLIAPPNPAEYPSIDTSSTRPIFVFASMRRT